MVGLNDADGVLLELIATDVVAAQVLPVATEHHQLPRQRDGINQSVAPDGKVAEEVAVAAVLRELMRFGVVDEDALSHGGDPDESLVGSADYFRHGRGDDDAIVRAQHEAAVGVLVAVEYVEARTAAKPDVALVLIERGDGVGFVGILGSDDVAIGVDAQSVVAVQAVFGTYPQQSVAVAQGACHGVVAQPVVGRELMGECRQLGGGSASESCHDKGCKGEEGLTHCLVES